MRLLIVEDDIELSSAMKVRLTKDGYEVECCSDGEDAVYYMCKPAYDLIILDRMLPGRDGLSLLKEVRQKKVTTPVLMVTALSGLSDKVDGLDAGADDYIGKPFDLVELEARIRALLRRPRQIVSAQQICAGDLELDENELILKCGDEKVSISKKEEELIKIFMQNENKTISRERLLSRGWGADAFIQDGAIDTYMHHIRRRLATVHSKMKIQTVHGVGYKLINGEK